MFTCLGVLSIHSQKIGFVVYLYVCFHQHQYHHHQQHRYKKCRPLNFWEDKHKRYIEENEVFDYTVWRAANAVMDVRMEDLRLDVKARIDAGERLEDIPYLGEGCYSEEEPGTD